MSGAQLGLLAIAILLLAYFTYGSYVARGLGTDPMRPTPAHTKRDGVDYLPTHSFVLMGHHFASIAGAAPIVGPITAAVFGWLPVVLWLLVGGILAGAVHDFASLMASVRHDGKSIGEVIGENVGAQGRALFLGFAWLALVLLIAAFVHIVASTFAAMPQVATATILFLALAVGFGLIVRATQCGAYACTVLAAVLAMLAVFVGQHAAVAIDPTWWKPLLLLYALAASLAPLWLLLQPRDYLNSFLLHALLAGALVGILVANPTLALPAYAGLYAAPIGHLFPMLFVTVACGAISGFHSLIASGTTAKLLKTEAHAKRIGYGAMLFETLLAITAVIAVASLSQGRYVELVGTSGPLVIYAEGMAGFLGRLGLPEETGVTFFGLAVSVFALTMLDTASRLGRYMLQEISSGKGPRGARWVGNRHIATVLTLSVSGLLLLGGHFAFIWPVFGAANQLLAALALLAVSVWLSRQGRDSRFTLYPMLFMLAVTLTALALMFWQGLAGGSWQLSLFCALLALLALVLLGMAGRALARSGRPAPQPAGSQPRDV